MIRLETLVMEADNLLKDGLHDPHEMFEKLYRGRRVHYSVVRKAIHIAKTR